MGLAEVNHLHGSLVRLTALAKDDAATLAGFSENTWVYRLMNSSPAVPYTVAETVKWIEKEQENPNSFHFGIRNVETGALLGFCELDEIEWNHRACMLGIGLGDPEDWGKGYGRDAMEVLLRFGFHELNLHRIGLAVFSYNARAVALYESLGFVREGTVRERLSRDGKAHDMLLYGLLRVEWEASR